MVNRNSLWRDGLRQAETETKMIWPCLKVFWFSRDNPVGHSERKKKKKADIRRGGKTISKSGQPSQLE